MNLEEIRQKLREEFPTSTYIKVGVETFAAQYNNRQSGESSYSLYISGLPGSGEGVHANGATLEEAIAKGKSLIADPLKAAREKAERLRAELAAVEAKLADGGKVS